MTTELSIQGMTCSNCARHVTEALQETPGVARASVSLEHNRASVTWREDAQPAPDRLIISLKEAGYEGAPIATDAPARSGLLEGWTINVALGSFVTIQLMIAEWILGLGMNQNYHWFAFSLATPVQFLCGWRFYRGAWLQAKQGSSNMDTLVALGSTTAYGFSLYQLLNHVHGHLYFMDAAAIITLISVGHWMESKMAVRAEETLKSLLTLAPDTARKIIGNAEREVPVSSLHPGDLIAIRPGDHIPTDGEVHEGHSAVDESMLTGESLPIEKSAGAKLFAGSINSNGRVTMRVTALGEQTALAKIIEVVQRAQNSRANIQKLGDRISNVFVPLVVLIAIVTAAAWFLISPGNRAEAALIHAAAVLIIACPCAMGLATPIAIMAGANAAAKKGILIRDGQALEKSGNITTILFDKTGTLTQGKLTLAAIEAWADNARALAASLASHSQHPLSRAIAGIDPTRLKLENFQEHRGSGLSANFNNQLLRLGSLTWTKAHTPEVSAFTDLWTNQGASVLVLTIDEKPAAIFALTDALKANAAEIISQLRSQGKNIAMVTGDNAATANTIAALLKITEVYSQIRPEQKSEIIRDLQAKGQRVAFIGDGINDAPALAQADLGIAMGSGADAARQAADIILLRAGLEAVPQSLALAQATLRTIKQNLFWAFFYNVIGVPLAAFGYFSPILGAAAMGFSDLIVIGNALRLKRTGR